MSKLFWIGGISLIIGGALVFAGCQEKRLAAAASAVPEEISLQALIARGPDGNPNIILKDFVLCENYVFRTKNGIWTGAWVPAVPQQAPNQFGGRPAVFQALIFTTNAKNQADLYGLCGQPRLRALMTNRISSLSGDIRSLLTESYPGTDFSRCLILQEGREPAGQTKLALLFGSGLIACLVGLGVGGFGFYLWHKERNAPPPKRRRRRAEDDDEDEEDRPASRRQRARADDDDDPGPPRRSRPDPDDGEDEPEDRPRRRPRQTNAEDQDEPPRRRVREDDDRPRKRRPSRRDDDE